MTTYRFPYVVMAQVPGYGAKQTVDYCVTFGETMASIAQHRAQYPNRVVSYVKRA